MGEFLLESQNGIAPKLEQINIPPLKDVLQIIYYSPKVGELINDKFEKEWSQSKTDESERHLEFEAPVSIKCDLISSNSRHTN